MECWEEREGSEWGRVTLVSGRERSRWVDEERWRVLRREGDLASMFFAGY